MEGLERAWHLPPHSVGQEVDKICSKLRKKGKVLSLSRGKRSFGNGKNQRFSVIEKNERMTSGRNRKSLTEVPDLKWNNRTQLEKVWEKKDRCCKIAPTCESEAPVTKEMTVEGM
jgi:hypothetical protein